MARKKYKPEEIVATLRQVDVLVSQGRAGTVGSRGGALDRRFGMSRHRFEAMPNQFTYYRWRREFGGLKTDQVKRLKELEKENQRFRT